MAWPAQYYIPPLSLDSAALEEAAYFRMLQRGKESESKVEEALRLLAQEEVIHHFLPTKPLGELDLRGVDFQVYVTRLLCMDLQVKSSQTGMYDHIAHYGFSIPCVVVEPFVRPEDLALTIEEIIYGEIDVKETSQHRLQIAIADVVRAREP